MLTPVSVHAHDEALLILDAHLVVDILLDAASEKALQKEWESSEWCLFACLRRDIMVLLSSSLPCSLRRRAHHNGTQMQCLRTPYTGVPYLRSLRKRTNNQHHQREEENNNGLANKEDKRKEGCKLALTGECACKTARSLGDCGVVVGR